VDGSADPEEQIQSTSCALDLPHFSGGCGSSGSFDGGVISLSPLHLFSWPLSRLRSQICMFTSNPAETWRLATLQLGAPEDMNAQA
jgi:hypothetical protein